MNSQTDDPGYLILVEVARSLGLEDHDGLLFDLYVIQKDHQFEKDRSASSTLMEKRILAEIDRAPESTP
jgi:hypothetical protein